MKKYRMPIVLTHEIAEIKDTFKEPVLKFSFVLKESSHEIHTRSKEKQNAGDVIAGGYNKQYSQPRKGEVKKDDENKSSY